MKKLFLFSASLLLAGCVSASAYRNALNESEARNAELQKARSELESAAAKNRSLEESLSSITAHLAGKEREAAECESDRARIADLNRETFDELSAARAELSSQTGEKDSLEREVERLRMSVELAKAEKQRPPASVKPVYDRLAAELKGEIEKGGIEIVWASGRLSVSVSENMLFDPESAEISPGGLELLKRIGAILKGVSDREIRVEGHTDNAPAGGTIEKGFSTNWHFSAARASSVASYLADGAGVNPALLSAAGYGGGRPLVSNATPEGRSRNRRMVITLLPPCAGAAAEEPAVMR